VTLIQNPELNNFSLRDAAIRISELKAIKFSLDLFEVILQPAKDILLPRREVTSNVLKLGRNIHKLTVRGTIQATFDNI